MLSVFDFSPKQPSKPARNIFLLKDLVLKIKLWGWESNGCSGMEVTQVWLKSYKAFVIWCYQKQGSTCCWKWGKGSILNVQSLHPFQKMVTSSGVSILSLHSNLVCSTPTWRSNRFFFPWRRFFFPLTPLKCTFTKSAPTFTPWQELMPFKEMPDGKRELFPQIQAPHIPGPGNTYTCGWHTHSPFHHLHTYTLEFVISTWFSINHCGIHSLYCVI